MTIIGRCPVCRSVHDVTLVDDKPGSKYPVFRCNRTSALYAREQSTSEGYVLVSEENYAGLLARGEEVNVNGHNNKRFGVELTRFIIFYILVVVASALCVLSTALLR